MTMLGTPQLVWWAWQRRILVSVQYRIFLDINNYDKRKSNAYDTDNERQGDINNRYFQRS